MTQHERIAELINRFKTVENLSIIDACKKLKVRYTAHKKDLIHVVAASYINDIPASKKPKVRSWVTLEAKVVPFLSAKLKRKATPSTVEKLISENGGNFYQLKLLVQRKKSK